MGCEICGFASPAGVLAHMTLGFSFRLTIMGVKPVWLSCSPQHHILLPEKAFFFFVSFSNVAQRSLYEVPLMEPAPHSCPHCLGQDEKRLLFRKAALSSPSNHASSHACSPSSVSEGGRGGEAGRFLGLGSPKRSDIMCFSESWGGLQRVVDLGFSVGGPESSGPVG